MTIKRDKKFYWHLFWQGLIAIVFIYLVLMSLGIVATSKIIWAAGAGSLSASAFIIFCSPSVGHAKPGRIIRGYLVGIICGEVMRLAANFCCRYMTDCGSQMPAMYIFQIAAMVSVGLAFVLMILLKSEHPPAAGLALVTALDIKNWEALLVILAAAAILALLRILFKRQLMDLLSN